MSNYEKLSDMELTRMIAERMGWTRIFGLNKATGYPPEGGKDRLTLPRFPSQISSAWLLVDDAEKRGHWCKTHSPFTPGDPYFAGFTPHGTTGWNGRSDFEASALTMPRAICLAYLKLRDALALADGGDRR